MERDGEVVARPRHSHVQQSDELVVRPPPLLVVERGISRGLDAISDADLGSTLGIEKDEARSTLSGRI